MNDLRDPAEADDAQHEWPNSRTKPPPLNDDLAALLKHAREPIVVNLNGRDVVVDRALLQYLTCDTTIRSLLVGPHDTPLDLGRTRRTASPAQRTAIGVRDKGCIFHGCDCPLHWCDAHHIEHWEDGGKTDICNLCLLCRTHHRLIHKDGWSIRMDADGLPTVTYRGIALPRNLHPPNFGLAA